MMRLTEKKKNQKAASAIEYAVLIIILLLGFLVFQKYIVRGLASRWKQAGDTFGYGLQYEPGSMGPQTIECAWSPDYDKWYDAQCYDETMQDKVDDCAADCEDNGRKGDCGTGLLLCGRLGSGCNDVQQYDPFTGGSFWLMAPAGCQVCCRERCKEACLTLKETIIDSCPGEDDKCIE